ncbi:ABC transporter permease [Membranihabitans maritimus]|uniref:ABC transporter permease n=1 Tax=Membranihabitans maritimus TaxID=2904244 RepID=UPI001F438919|nr:ABC transporter permease [Membranihabitans maritimus]
MRTIIILLRKEFRQILRNPVIRAMILIMPIVQLIVLPFAADYEMDNIQLGIIDNDHSSFSEMLITNVTSSGYFQVSKISNSYNEAFKSIESGTSDIILEIPKNFEKDLFREGKQALFIAPNAINGSEALLGSAYLRQIIQDFEGDICPDVMVLGSIDKNRLEITSSNWYNPSLDYHLFMVPGILAILVTMIGGFLSALNIVKEKEVGTIEQINVTPIRKHHFILGKLIPFWILGNIVFTLGTLISWLVYGITPEGSLILLYFCIGVFLLAILGLGFFISTFCNTQQQAMLIMFFFMMIFILMGGLFTPIESMPNWAQVITYFNPLRYLIDIMRMVVLKGSGFHHVAFHLIILSIFAVVFNFMAVLNYKKTS